MELTREEYDALAFDPRQYDEPEERESCENEAYDELMDYNRLTLGKA